MPNKTIDSHDALCAHILTFTVLSFGRTTFFELAVINRKIHGCLEIPDLFLVLNMKYTLYLFTTLNISIQIIDCNNLQNSYVLRTLCFWGEGDWLGAGGRGGG